MTGRLTRLSADLDKDGEVDTWTHMDGTTILRTERDTDGDGRIDRWEYPAGEGVEARVALSRRKTGAPDLWTFVDDAGQPVRIEYASSDASLPGSPARVDRVEFFEQGRLVRVEEDTDGNGRMDKWEYHDGRTLQAAEFDHDADGRPDERVTFGPGGRVVGRQKIR